MTVIKEEEGQDALNAHKSVRLPTTTSAAKFRQYLASIIEKVHPHLLGRRDGKPFRNNHPQCTQPGSNPDLPVFGSLVQHESGALDLAATEAGASVLDVDSFRSNLLPGVSLNYARKLVRRQCGSVINIVKFCPVILCLSGASGKVVNS
ncbi:unnamed protein product [Timema podura]|uniref:Uncharacterized protein n=1 Tax=Timema podura TaxID=61482 RepID=A0ABN7P5E4_TIMPD|nr:unnamed protein product [Timema podura]